MLTKLKTYINNNKRLSYFFIISISLILVLGLANILIRNNDFRLLVGAYEEGITVSNKDFVPLGRIRTPLDPRAPIINDFSATKYSIRIGESTNLKWDVSRANTAKINNGVGEVAKNYGSVSVSPKTSTMYQLAAYNKFDIVTRYVLVEVLNEAPPAPTATFSANPVNIDYGSSSTLTWNTTDASSVSIDQGIGSVYPSSSIVVFPKVSTTYTLTVVNSVATIVRQVTVTVVPPPVPTATISANPATLTFDTNQTSTLTWSTTDAESVSIDQGIGTVTSTGTKSVSPTATTTYTITATNISGTTSKSTTVTVVMPPLPTISSFSANPTSIAYGTNATSTLSWTTTGAKTVSIDQNIGTVASTGTKSVSPAVTTTYTITATNITGAVTQSATVTVVKPPLPTITISATPATITAGTNQTSTLSWSTTDAASVSIDQNIGTVASSGTKVVSPTTTTTYTVTATNVTGTTTKSATVTVVLPPPPTASISVSPTGIVKGATSTLSWSTANATSITIDQNIGTVSSSGTKSVSPTTTTTYTITATNIAATTTKSVTLTVYQPPTATLQAVPVTLIQGASSTLTWSTTNATTVTLDGVNVAASGTKSVAPQTTTTYTLAATGLGGQVSATATVTVTPPAVVPTIKSFAASPTSITAGGSSTLSWTIENAVSASISQNVGTVSATSGTKSVSPTATTTYTLTATNQTGSKTADVVVTVTQQPPSDVINIKTVYGAKGDGTSDDTTAINNAIAGIKAGQTLYFPMGDYKYSGNSITPLDGTSIIGDITTNRRSWVKTGLTFGSNQVFKNIMFGKSNYYALKQKDNHTATNTVFENCRFRGGGPKPGVNYDPGSTSYTEYYPVVQLGGSGVKRSLSKVSFNNCEFERGVGPYISTYVRANVMSIWEDNRAGYSHIEYLTFNKCHFGVKNEAGEYGANSANIEFMANKYYSDSDDFSHHWHDLLIKDTIFERSGEFNIDFNDAARSWIKAHGMSESGTTNGIPNWRVVPMKYRAGNETGRSVTVVGGQIKGAGFNGSFSYVFCLENPIGATFTDVTAWGGARTNPEVESASSACGPILTAPLPDWTLPLQYDPKGMNAVYNNTYYPGQWGTYTASAYDPGASSAQIAPNLPDRGDLWSDVTNFFTEAKSAVVSFFEKLF